MNLSTRLNTLEGNTRKALWCLWCRYNLRTTPPLAKGAPDTEHIKAKCWFCGTSYNVPTEGRSDKLVEAQQLVILSHPTKLFNDERVHAAKLWIDYALAFPLIPYYQGREIPRARELSKKAQARKEAAEAFHNSRMEAFRQKANGPAAFPIDLALDKIKSEHDPQRITLPADAPPSHHAEIKGSISRINVFLEALRSAAACELVLWGEVLPETKAEIDYFETEQKERVATEIKKALAEDQEQERLRTNRAAQTSEPAETLQRPSAHPQEVVEVAADGSLAKTNEVSVILVEEETASQRIMRMWGEHNQREGKREPVTLPKYPTP